MLISISGSLCQEEDWIYAIKRSYSKFGKNILEPAHMRAFALFEYVNEIREIMREIIAWSHIFVVKYTNRAGFIKDKDGWNVRQKKL